MIKKLSLILSLALIAVCFSGCTEANLSIDRTDVSISVGEKTTLYAIIDGERVEDVTSVIWSSSDKKIASVVNGIVTGVKEGRVIITAEDESGSTATCSVSVTGLAAPADLKKITFKQSSAAVAIKDELTLSFTSEPADYPADALIWKSSDDKIATVSAGVVKGVSKGSAVITASSEDQLVTAACVVTVNQTGASSDSFKLDRTNVSLVYSKEVTSSSYAILKPVFSSEKFEDKEIVWVSSNETVAKISQKGVVVAIGEGDAVITATSKKNDMVAVCNVKVTKAVVPVSYIEVLPGANDIDIGESFTPTVYINPEDATETSITWKTSDPTVATVNPATGVIRGVSEGFAVITATANGDPTKYSICMVSVSEPEAETIMLDKASLKLYVGEQDIITVIPFSETVTWSSENPKIVTVDNSGIVTAISKGTARIVAKNSKGITAFCNVIVTDSTTSTTSSASSATTSTTTTSGIIDVKGINLSFSNITVNVGDVFDIEANAMPANATDRTIRWNSENADLATVSNGKVTAKAAGTVKIFARSGAVESFCTVTIKEVPITGISLTPSSGTVNTGESVNVTASFTPSNHSDSFNWSVSDPSIASISASGSKCTVTATGSSGQVITVSCTSSGGISESVNITIN